MAFKNIDCLICSSVSSNIAVTIHQVNNPIVLNIMSVDFNVMPQEDKSGKQVAAKY
jgi:hypothetical protein